MRNTKTLLALTIAISAVAIAFWLIPRPTAGDPTAPMSRHRSRSESKQALEGLPPPASAARSVMPNDFQPEPKAVDEPEVGELSIAGDKYKTKTTRIQRQIFFPTGELYAESPLLDGKQNGTCKCWYKNGQLHAQEEYVNDTREGRSTYYSDSGARIAEGEYFHGYMDGTWVTWYENGLKESEGAYDTRRRWDAGVHAQEKCGYWSFWNPEGRIDADRSGVYEHDERVAR